MTEDEITKGLEEGSLEEESTTFTLMAGHHLTLDSVLEGVMVRPGEWKVEYSGEYRATVNGTNLYKGESTTIYTKRDAIEVSVNVSLIGET